MDKQTCLSSLSSQIEEKVEHPSQLGIQPFLVGFGVDTLYLNVSYADPDNIEKKSKRILDQGLVHDLSDLQALAKEQESELVSHWSFGGVPLMMQTHGAGKGQWSWLLTSPLVDLMISRGRLNGIIAQVRLSARFLWSEASTGDALYKVHTLLMEIFGEDIYLQVSSIDLCADIVGWNPGLLDWKERFISRATGDHAYPGDGFIDGPEKPIRRWKKITGLIFGSYSGRLACKIYDKTLEIAQKSPEKMWFFELWNRYGWDGSAQVWRVEFHFSREFLRDMKIDGAYDMLGQFSEMWTYAVGRIGGGDDGLPDGWLRLVVPGEDSNRSRWEIDSSWEVIQSAFVEDEELYRNLGAVVFHDEKEVNVKRMLSQITGCVTSMAAQGADLYPELGMTLYDVMEWLSKAIEIQCVVKETPFRSLVIEKRSKLVLLKQEVSL